MPYKLSSTLQSHTADVRAVLAPSPLRVFSASRDSTAIVWTRPNDTSPFTATTVYRPSPSYIGSLAYVPPTKEAPEGYLVTGSQDSIINVYIIGSGSEDPAYTLVGHLHNVCTLDATPSGVIISGSWDKTARVWKSWQSAYELQGHTQSVLAVLALPQDTPAFSAYSGTDQYLTASGDKSIKLWVQNKAVRTFHGHTDAVRALALLPDIGFASSSNDTEIRVWTAEGDLVHILGGHTSFVYSLSVLDDGGIISGGEDRTLRVWKGGECVQSIVHPAISVWTVAAVRGSGDVVSGCSDGVVRVFSLAESRWLSEGDLKAYDEMVAASAIPAQTTNVDKSNLPGMEVLSQPGKKEGQVIMVNTPAGGVEAHMWTEGAWQKVGDVVDPPGGGGGGGKQMYQGKEYDHVFEVDAAEGAPKLKLPYNESEDAFVAAQRFLNAHDLPASYLDEVVGFIDKMVGRTRQPVGGSQFVDPYTGASRYVAPGATSAPSNASTFVDPYTGASRYQAAGAPPAGAAAPPSEFMDPFTGASRYTAAGTPSPAPPPASYTKILPVHQTLPFRTANIPAMRTKLLQLNDMLQSDISTSVMALSKNEQQSIENVFNFLNEVAPLGKAGPTLNWGDVDVVLQIATRWPQNHRFPVVDLIRLVNAFSPVPTGAPLNSNELILDALLAAADTSEWPAPGTPLSKSAETNLLLALRALANFFQIGPQGKSYGGGEWTQKLISALLAIPLTATTKPQRMALSTLLFNLSCVLGGVPAAVQAAHRELVLKVLQIGDNDSETTYRALVALGNSLNASTNRDTSIRGKLNELAKQFDEVRVKDLVKEINALLG